MFETPFVIAIALATLGGAIFVAVMWWLTERNRPTPTRWFCGDCQSIVDEPAFTMDPADLDAYCPDCHSVLWTDVTKQVDR